MQTSIRLERSSDRAVLVLASPAGKPPTLDHSSLSELDDAITTLAAEPPRIIIVRSTEPKYFCVGANLHVLKQMDAETIVPWVMLGHRVLNRLEDLPCPVVAHVAGYAMGGGLELAMACDLVFASATAKFAQSEAALGFIPGWGGTQRLVERTGVAMAKHLFYTGRMVDAETARQIGLVDLVSPTDQLDAATDEFAGAVLKNSAYSLATFKRIVNEARQAERDRAATVEAQYSRGCLLDSGTQERLQAFLNKRK